MRWQLRQVMASRGLFQTSELVPLLAERGVYLSRQYVHKLVTTPPQRVNIDLLAALCDILDCQPNDLLEPVIEPAEQTHTGTGDDTDGPTTGSRRAGLDIGDLRPIRARVRRPHQHK